MIGNPVQIGIYSVAEKFLNSGRQFLAVYFNYSIPRMFESFQLHGAKGITFFRKQYFSLLIGLSILLIIIFILKSKISILFLNEENLDFQKLLLIFSLILIAVAINIPFFMYLLFSNKKKMYNFILLIGLIILIIMCFYTAVRYKSLGIAFSILISEIIVSSLLIYSANQKSNIIHYLIKAKS
jgi:PST family polysaccharide transporter